MKKGVLLSCTVIFFVLGIIMEISAEQVGSDRPAYERDNPPDHVVFNSMTDNPELGDERDFVRIREKNDERGRIDLYSHEIELHAGKEYEVLVYYHNNASEDLNDADHDHAGIARNAAILFSFPDSIKAGEESKLLASVVAANIDPAIDTVNVTAKEDVTLQIDGYESILYDKWNKDGVAIDTEYSTALEVDGILGASKLSDAIPGGYEHAGYVVYTFRTVSANKVVDDINIDSSTQTDANDLDYIDTEESEPNQSGSIWKMSILLCIGVLIGIIISRFIFRKR